MKNIELTQGKFAIVDDEDFEELSKHSWCIGDDGYALRGQRTKNGPSRNIKMHRQIMGLEKKDGKVVDHINRNKLDNRRENLRICTPSQNQHNKPACHQNTSGFKGVTWHKGAGKWMAQIMTNKKYKYLGLYEKPEAAYAAYCAAALELHGEFASTK